MHSSHSVALVCHTIDWYVLLQLNVTWLDQYGVQTLLFKETCCMYLWINYSSQLPVRDWVSRGASQDVMYAIYNVWHSMTFIGCLIWKSVAVAYWTMHPLYHDVDDCAQPSTSQTNSDSTEFMAVCQSNNMHPHWTVCMWLEVSYCTASMSSGKITCFIYHSFTTSWVGSM